MTAMSIIHSQLQVSHTSLQYTAGTSSSQKLTTENWHNENGNVLFFFKKNPMLKKRDRAYDSGQSSQWQALNNGGHALSKNELEYLTMDH